MFLFSLIFGLWLLGVWLRLLGLLSVSGILSSGLFSISEIMRSCLKIFPKPSVLFRLGVIGSSGVASGVHSLEPPLPGNGL